MKNNFSFVSEIQAIRSQSLYVSSFDVSSLFTSIPLDETIEIDLDYTFQNCNKVNGLSRSQCKKLMIFATKETNFIFSNKVYDQIDSVAMGSPLAPILANIFMRHLEERAFETYRDTPPMFYCRYVDDSFLLFYDKSHVQSFFDFMNNLHPNIKFTKEDESMYDGYFPFLDVEIQRTDDCIHTSTYYKPTHMGLYTNWFSFTPRKHKINLVQPSCQEHGEFVQLMNCFNKIAKLSKIILSKINIHLVL